MKLLWNDKDLWLGQATLDGACHENLKHLQTILLIHPGLHLTIESQSGIFQWIINRQRIQAPLGIRSGPYPRFCLIIVNPEDVAVIVVNVDAVMHRLYSACINLIVISPFV